MKDKLQERLDNMERRYIARYELKHQKVPVPIGLTYNVQLIKDYSAFMKKGIKLFLESK